MEGFTGDDRIVADYFRDEVLARLSPGLARFLTRTSVLDRLSAPLCDAILEQTGSASKLHKLERSNLFLVPLDRQRVWYRYHTLFAEMLRSRLRDAEPGLELELHRRASDWYAEHGEPEEAIRHALAAGHVERAGDLVWANVVRYRGRGRGPVLLRWLSAFTEEQIAGYPPLALAAAWASLGVESGAVGRWTATAARGSYEGPLSDGTTCLESALALLRATIAKDGVTRDGGGRCPLHRARGGGQPMVAEGLLPGGRRRASVGRPGAARRRLEEGERLASAFGAITVRAMCLAQLAALAVDRGLVGTRLQRSPGRRPTS